MEVNYVITTKPWGMYEHITTSVDLKLNIMSLDFATVRNLQRDRRIVHAFPSGCKNHSQPDIILESIFLLDSRPSTSLVGSSFTNVHSQWRSFLTVFLPTIGCEVVPSRDPALRATASLADAGGSLSAALSALSPSCSVLVVDMSTMATRVRTTAMMPMTGADTLV